MGHAPRDRPLQAAVFLFGAFTLSAQILLLQALLVSSHGDELLLGILLGAYLLWGAAGSWAGAAASRRLTRPVPALGAAMLAAGLLLPATLFTLAGVRPLLGALAVQTLPLSTLLAAFPLLLAPFCAVAGATFPLAVAVLAPAGGGARRVYMLEAGGGGLGALAIHLLLSPRMQPMDLACLLGVLAAAGALLVSVARRGRAGKVQTGAAGLVGLVCLAGAMSGVPGEAGLSLQ